MSYCTLVLLYFRYALKLGKSRAKWGYRASWCRGYATDWYSGKI